MWDNQKVYMNGVITFINNVDNIKISKPKPL